MDDCSSDVFGEGGMGKVTGTEDIKQLNAVFFYLSNDGDLRTWSLTGRRSPTVEHGVWLHVHRNVCHGPDGTSLPGWGRLTFRLLSWHVGVIYLLRHGEALTVTDQEVICHSHLHILPLRPGGQTADNMAPCKPGEERTEAPSLPSPITRLRREMHLLQEAK